MSRSDRQLHLSTFLAGSALTLTVVVGHVLGFFEVLENGLYDLRAQQCQYCTPKPTQQLVHVDIDDASQERGACGRWPWPRTLMADLVDEMALAGPKVIALDVILPDPQEVDW